MNGGRRDLCDLAVGLCDGVLPLLPPGPPVDAVGAVRSRLTESALRIAVGGRLNAGKSTLVNALLGRRLAATASTECTMLVAWFRKGPQNRIEVRLADGRRHCVSGRPGGGVPYDVTRLGAPREQIEEIVVEVTDCLATGEYTLVDTPGMDSLSGLDDVAMRVLARTDALLYVMPHPGAGDLEALEALRRQAGARVTAINAVGVLSRIDELGPGVGDPWVDARRIGATYTRLLSGKVAEVVPVVGLLAQTALGDGFTERDTALVRRLAGAGAGELDLALYSPDDFRRWESGPLTAEERERMLDLLGRYGIAVAVAAVRAGAGTGTLLGELRRASGVDALLDHVQRRFVAASDRLRATAALGLLEEIAAAAIRADPSASTRTAVDCLRQGVAAVRQHPMLRQAELSAALEDLASGRLLLPEGQAAALIALATGRDPAECLGCGEGAAPGRVASAAAAQVTEWRRVESGPSRVARRHARTARVLCEEFYFAAEAGPKGRRGWKRGRQSSPS